jgi:hypothetical protein
MKEDSQIATRTNFTGFFKKSKLTDTLTYMKNLKNLLTVLNESTTVPSAFNFRDILRKF